jgi:hypothetical protein
MTRAECEPHGDNMNGNAATRQILDNQPVVVPMEARIARIESDVGHIKVTLKELRGDMKAANESIAGLKVGLGELKGGIGVVRQEIKTQIHALETKMIKWVIGTVLATGGLVFSIGRFLL